MKIYRYITVIAMAAALAISCQPEEQVEFAIEGDLLEVGADGGTVNLKVNSPGAWTAIVSKPWITVSPTNGHGSQICQVIIDSSLSYLNEEAVREGVISIQDDMSYETKNISIRQENYKYQITLDESEIDIPEYDVLSNRWFDVNVKSNIDFKISFKDKDDNDINWIEPDEENPELELNKGARPRNVKLRFEWKINQQDSDRLGKIVFTPQDANQEPITVNLDRIDTVKVSQTAAETIEPDTRRGDSTAIVAIARALNEWSGGWDTSTPMNTWSDVVLWEEGDDTEPENIGRVRYVRFFMFNTEDGLPYQVKYLTAAEEVVFYSNENNTRRKGIVLGEDICELDQLKRLTIAAYGLDDESLSERFFTKEDSSPAFPNLEYLNLSSNNFMEIPEGICEKNFPKLHALLMNNNQRILVTDASNAAVNDDKEFAEKYAGLFNEYINPENIDAGGSFPVRFLSWENLDTLQFTLNYFQGSLPSDDYLKSKGFPNWKDDDKIMDDEGKVILSVADSLKNGDTDFFSTHQIPRVLPRIKSLSINLNRMSGEVPNWILRHPNLDIWDPFVFIFTQEGRDRNGNAAGFSNAPKNLNDYYEVFGNKKYDPDNMVDDDEADDSSEAGTGSTR